MNTTKRNEVCIVEAQITDCPEYETYVGCYAELDDALNYAKECVKEAMWDCEGGDPTVKDVGKGQYRVYDGDDGLTVYFVTVVEVK